MKNYKELGVDAEILGRRLDATRLALSCSRTDWAQNYWQRNLDRLMLQWSFLPALHDSDAQVTIIPRWTVSYDFFEGSQELGGYGIIDRLWDMTFKHKPDLNQSWEQHRAQRLARAQ